MSTIKPVTKAIGGTLINFDCCINETIDVSLSYFPADDGIYTGTKNNFSNFSKGNTISTAYLYSISGGWTAGSVHKIIGLKNGYYIGCRRDNDTGAGRALYVEIYKPDNTYYCSCGNMPVVHNPNYPQNTYYIGLCKDEALNKYGFTTCQDTYFTCRIYLANRLTGLIEGVTEDPYETSPSSGQNGGYGDFDYTSDDIDFSGLPTLSVVDSGFVTLYSPTIQQLKDLAAYLWSGLFDINTFRKIFADPMDCIISLAMLPITPTGTTPQELKVGNIGTGININRLSQQFVSVDFEMKNIGLRTNGFMDFSPYTKCQIFLPYIGIRSLSIDDIAGKDLTLKYKIDLFTGSCNAAIKCGGSVLYQFTGNVIADIPITASSFSGFIQAAIGAVGAAVGVATGAGAITGVASAINAATAMKPDIEKSGNLSATAGFLGQQLPYLILTYPNLCRPSGRDKTVGTPSFIGLSSSNPSKPLSSFHGITKLHKINVRSIPCTDAERDEIEALLMEGVIMP